MILARRIRGDRHYDFVDRSGAGESNEPVLELPKTNNAAAWSQLKKDLAANSTQ